MKGTAADDAAGLIGAKPPDADALASPEVPMSLRVRIVSARLAGGDFARQVADEVAEMIDDGRLSLAVGAEILRAIKPRDQPQRGDFQVGDTRGGDGPLESPADGWGRGGADDWGGGGKNPAMRDVAPPSAAPGYLYLPDGKGRRAMTLTKGRKPTRLERKCELIKTGPFNVRPDMRAIERQVAREFELGLIAA
jgi:hypothetical protein